MATAVVSVDAASISGLGSKAQPLSGRGVTLSTMRLDGDFTATLPSPVKEAPFLAALKGMLISKGVLLESLSVARTPPTRQSLERVSLQVSLSGAYIATVELIEELLRQFPGSTVQSMQFTRKETGGVDTALVLNLWGRSSESPR